MSNRVMNSAFMEILENYFQFLNEGKWLVVKGAILLLSSGIAIIFRPVAARSNAVFETEAGTG